MLSLLFTSGLSGQNPYLIDNLYLETEISMTVGSTINIVPTSPPLYAGFEPLRFYLMVCQEMQV